MKLLITLLLVSSAWAESRSIDRSFTLPAGPRTVEIRGISGFIRVTGTTGDRAEFHIDERLAGVNASDVEVRFTESGGTVRAEVEKRGREWKSGERIEHDFTVKVPRDVRLVVRNVNGEIQVANVSGAYELKTVNGPITLDQAAAGGSLETVNGPMRATYTTAPPADVRCKTVNGKIELFLPASLNADFQIKTMNGKVYTDFPMTSQAARQEGTGAKQGTKWVYRADGNFRGRVGQGGPLFTLSGINGTILIHNSQK